MASLSGYVIDSHNGKPLRIMSIDCKGDAESIASSCGTVGVGRVAVTARGGWEEDNGVGTVGG
jgi:hypothetical protein